MTELNLPRYDVKIRGTRQKPEIYDFLRRRFVALTPEEWVRQHFTHFLVEHMGYPQALLGNEIELHAGSKRLRCDSILYDEQLKPRIILEYKAPSVALTQKVFNQISTYNFLLHVDYLMVMCRHSMKNTSKILKVLKYMHNLQVANTIPTIGCALSCWILS